MKVEAWLVMKATRSQWQNYSQSSPYAGQGKVDRIKVVKVAQNKPAVDEDSVAMKIELDVPEEMFLEGTATIKATVPMPNPADSEIQAQVDMPVRGRAKSAAAAVIKP